jgi:hypothetical protein
MESNNTKKSPSLASSMFPKPGRSKLTTDFTVEAEQQEESNQHYPA